MNKKELQDSLPEGLRLESELTEELPLGLCFSAIDERIPNHNPVKRTIYFLEFTAAKNWEDKWEDQLMSRLHSLSSMPMRCVARPLEIGTINEGAILFIVTDYQKSNLSDQIRKEKFDPEQPSQKLELFGQIVEGLHELHQLKIPHGSLSPKNISFIETGVGSAVHCQIRNAEWGPLLKWAKGTVSDDEAKSFFPPEWKGVPKTPTKEADLYALGVLGCKLFLGDDGHVSPNDQEALSDLENKLKRKDTPPHICNLLCQLLQPQTEKRLADISEVQQIVKLGSCKNICKTVLQRLKHLSLMGKSSLILCLLILCVSPILVFTGVTHRRKLEEELGELHTSITELKQEVSDLEDDKKNSQLSWQIRLKEEQGRITQLKKEIAELKKEPPAGPAAKIIADKIWNKLSEKELFWGEFAIQIMKELDKEKPKVTVRREAIRLLKTKFDDSQLALRYAVKIWARFAKKTNLNWNDFKSQTLNAIAGESRNDAMTKQMTKHLKKWHSEFDNKSGEEWTLSLLKGKVDGGKNFGKGRFVIVFVNTKEKGWDKSPWDSNNSHTYGKEEGNIEFKWTTGNTIGIFMESDEHFNNNMISGGLTIRVTHDPITTTGPVAIWRLNMEEWVKDRNGTGAALKLNIVDCPGPTYKQYQSLKTVPKVISTNLQK